MVAHAELQRAQLHPDALRLLTPRARIRTSISMPFSLTTSIFGIMSSGFTSSTPPGPAAFWRPVRSPPMLRPSMVNSGGQHGHPVLRPGSPADRSGPAHPRRQRWRTVRASCARRPRRWLEVALKPVISRLPTDMAVAKATPISAALRSFSFRAVSCSCAPVRERPELHLEAWR